MSGTLSVSGRDGVIDGIDLARAGLRLEPADLRAALAGGSTAFERLDIAATLTNGAANFTSARFSGPAGTGDATGFVDFAGRTMEMRLALHPAVTDPPDLGLRLSGSVASPARTPEFADAIRWRAEHPPAPAAPASPGWITPH